MSRRDFSNRRLLVHLGKIHLHWEPSPFQEDFASDRLSRYSIEKSNWIYRLDKFRSRLDYLSIFLFWAAFSSCEFWTKLSLNCVSLFNFLCNFRLVKWISGYLNRLDFLEYERSLSCNALMHSTTTSDDSLSLILSSFSTSIAFSSRDNSVFPFSASKNIFHLSHFIGFNLLVYLLF